MYKSLSCSSSSSIARPVLPNPSPSLPRRSEAKAALFTLCLFFALNPGASAQTTTPALLTKQAALQNVLSQQIIPGYRGLAAKCHALTVALDNLDEAPAPAGLEPARKAWTAALLEARRVQWLQSGPIADRESLSWFYYSKVLPERIDGILGSSRSIDDAYVGEFGASARGLFALEQLLFQPEPAGAPAGAAPNKRRIQYALVLSRQLETRANQIAVDWSATGDQAAGPKFLAAGQPSLSLVVNELAQSLEQIAEQRLNFVLLLPQPVSHQLNRIEGSKSRTSQQSVLELLEGARSIYRGNDGNGLEGFLRHLNAPLADRLNSQFEAALSGVKALDGPLEQAAATKRPLLQSAYEKTRALEVMFKVDVASAFGVTLTFTSNDGD
jgi:predicted lipoprotein